MEINIIFSEAPSSEFLLVDDEDLKFLTTKDALVLLTNLHKGSSLYEDLFNEDSQSFDFQELSKFLVEDLISHYYGPIYKSVDFSRVILLVAVDKNSAKILESIYWESQIKSYIWMYEEEKKMEIPTASTLPGLSFSQMRVETDPTKKFCNSNSLFLVTLPEYSGVLGQEAREKIYTKKRKSF